MDLHSGLCIPATAGNKQENQTPDAGQHHSTQRLYCTIVAGDRLEVHTWQHMQNILTMHDPTMPIALLLLKCIRQLL